MAKGERRFEWGDALSQYNSIACFFQPYLMFHSLKEEKGVKNVKDIEFSAWSLLLF